MGDNYTQQIHDALVKTTTPDTQMIKEATVQLNGLYKDVRCVPSLFEIATGGGNEAVTLLALTELRKRILAKKNAQWNKQSEDVRNAIKARLLESVPQVGKGLRNALIKLIEAIASADVKKDAWPELQQWILAATSSEDATAREVGFQTLSNVLYSFFVRFSKSKGETDQLISQVAGIVTHGVADPVFAVRIWAVRAVGDVADFATAKHPLTLSVLQRAFPQVVQALTPALETGDESDVKAVIDAIQELVLSHSSIVNSYVPDVIEYLLKTAANPAFDEEQRAMTLNCLYWIVKWKKTRILSLNLMPAIINELLPISAVEDDPDSDDELSLFRTCMTLVDQFSKTFPPKHVFPPLFEKVKVFSTSQNPLERKAAINALGDVIEGCSLFILPFLPEVWPIVGNALNDSDVSVRVGACTALSFMCEFFDEECAKQHAILLPAVFRLINHPQTQKRACYALDCLLEILGPDIEPYIPDLMTSLLSLLDSAPVSIKGSIVGAIGSAAHASKEKIVPYLSDALQRIVPFLDLDSDLDALRLRGISQDTVGTLADAVGKEAFRPYFEPIMGAALRALDIKDAPHLKECSYVYFSVMARLYGNEFAPYVPTVMPILLAAASQEEFSFDDDEDEVTSGAAAAAAADGSFATSQTTANLSVGDEDDGDFSDVDEELDDEDELMKAATAIAYEKEMAVDSVAEIVADVTGAAVPFVEKTLEVFLRGIDNQWAEGVRKSSLRGLLKLITTFYGLNGRPGWTAGSNPARLPKETQDVIDASAAGIVGLLDDEDLNVVTTVCVELGNALEEVGPALLFPGQAEDVFNYLEAIFKGKAACQRDLDDEEDDEAPEGAEGEGAEGDNATQKEQSEYDALLIDEASNLLARFALVLGPEFHAVLGRFLPDLLRFAEPDRQPIEKSAVLGALADITKNMGPSITSYAPHVYPVYIRSLSDEGDDVKTNAAYALGLLVLHTETDLSAEYMTILQALSPLFSGTETSKSSLTVRDNACGAVARLILKNAAALPLDQVVPVLIGALPLRVDFAESQPVFSALFFLFRSQNETVYAHIDALLSVFKQALDSVSTGAFQPDSDSAQITEGTRNELIELLRFLNERDAQKIAAAGLSAYL